MNLSLYYAIGLAPLSDDFYSSDIFCCYDSINCISSEKWVRGSPRQSHRQRSGWTSLTQSSAVPSVTMAPVWNVACKFS